MKDRLQALIDEPAPAGVDPAEVEESKALLRWIGDHHFTFLGYREYSLTGEELRADEGSGLGLLRGGVGHVSTAFAKLPPAVRAFALEPHPLVLTKANARSPVHRPGYLDYVGVKRFDADGKVVGERRFLGLYTTLAYRALPLEIPMLRRTVGEVLRARRVPAREPRLQGAQRDHRHLPARRAVPDERGRALRGRARDPRPGRAPARQVVPAHGPLPALRLLPGLPPARSLQHRQPPADRRDPHARRSAPSRSTGSCG